MVSAFLKRLKVIDEKLENVPGDATFSGFFILWLGSFFRKTKIVCNCQLNVHEACLYVVLMETGCTAAT